MILCSIVATFLGVLFYSYYKIELGHGDYLTPLQSCIVSICIFIFALPAGILLLMKKYTDVSIALTVFSLISGFSLSFILISNGHHVWPGGILSGLLVEWPMIVLSITALVLVGISRTKSK